ncbi:MAG: peroxiredoxin [Betaproteobacteria bacterium]|nr:peroxiredoxin [Betaproteobacteria bacterium]
MLQEGYPAPQFALPDADMELFELKSMLGRHVVLFFYPKDGTPGCTLQASEFSDHEDQFTRHDCIVAGISGDDCISHAEFRDRHGLTVRLLSDAEREVSRLYCVWQQREVDGVRRMGVVRSTFIIDRSGIIRHALYGVNPRGHVAEVLRLVKSLDLERQDADCKEHGRNAALQGVGPGRKPG